MYLKKVKHQVQIYTDQKHLLYFITIKILNKKQMRQAEKLPKYYFKINYKKKSENEKADALSRRTNYFDEKNKLNEAIFNAKKKRMKYNKEYFMVTQKIEKDDALFKKIQKVTGKNQITKK